jgi:Protein of unknown function (DUF2958)
VHNAMKRSTKRKKQMKLLTKEILKKLPKPYSQENNPDPMVICKFFTPWANWTWYMIEYDPEERVFLSYVEGDECEMGYVSLDELEAIKGPVELKVERDLWFKPCKLSEVRK